MWVVVARKVDREKTAILGILKEAVLSRIAERGGPRADK